MPPIPAHVADRLNLDRERTRQLLANDPDALKNVTNSELDNALTGVDQASIFDEARSTLTVQVWDRKSPINGVAASHFLNRDDVDENGTDDIYLLIQNGRVIAFQPHEPYVTGIERIPKGQGKTRGEKHADDVAAAVTIEEIGRRVREHIRAARGL